jgi:hypothetical protein
MLLKVQDDPPKRLSTKGDAPNFVFYCPGRWDTICLGLVRLAQNDKISKMSNLGTKNSREIFVQIK